MAGLCATVSASVQEPQPEPPPPELDLSATRVHLGSIDLGRDFDSSGISDVIGPSTTGYGRTRTYFCKFLGAGSPP